MDEFALIKSCFAPLARGFGASLDLTDDAALIDIPAGYELVVTKDAISEGIHFLGSEDPALIAKKLLRVNLSDMAAMGAKPLCYFLAILLPKHTDIAWVQRFSEGLGKDQKIFSIHLAGGDTTATNGSASFSVTMMGTVKKGAALRRNAACAGDDVYVSGTLGDSTLGLLSLQQKIAKNAALEQRYYLPEPRVALGQKLGGIVHAVMDISDGLLQDLGHICTASNISATIERGLIPLSAEAKVLVEKDVSLWECVLAGGDDYELLFTAPVDKAAAIAALAMELELPLTKIGTVAAGHGVALVDESGKLLHMKRKGFIHF